MQDREPSAFFDEWAPSYDDDVRRSAGAFPFAGYDDLLGAVVALVTARGGTMLDLGCGTGTLLGAVATSGVGSELWGIDASPAMLDRARAKVPTARLVGAGVEELPRLSLPRFDAVVSTYLLHEFPDPRKLEILAHLWEDRLRSDGVLVVGDIAFASAADRQAVRRASAGWDESEDYLAADEFVPRLATLGIPARFRPVSFCAGLLVAERPPRGDAAAESETAGNRRTPAART